ncbi:MAG: hypothetical protein ACQETE_13680 [Bacteroidota bacterium]
MSDNQEKVSFIERKAEALVILRYLDFDFIRASEILQIPENVLHHWVDNFDETWKKQIPQKHLELSQVTQNGSAKKNGAVAPKEESSRTNRKNSMAI